MESKYQTLGRVGEGTYGVVFKAKDRVTQRVLALKQIRCGVVLVL
jgi:serine/threonine protein kinase